MIHVLIRSTGEVRAFEGIHWVKPTRSCPAPCCAGSPQEHASDGVCVVGLADDGHPECRGYFRSADGVEYADCSCSSPECSHGAELRARVATACADSPRGEAFVASRLGFPVFRDLAVKE